MWSLTKKDERFSREEVLNLSSQKKKGCAGKEIQDLGEEWRRIYALIGNREMSTFFLSVIVGNLFLVARLEVMSWWCSSNWYRHCVPTEGSSVAYGMWRSENQSRGANFIPKERAFLPCGSGFTECSFPFIRTMFHCFLCPFQLLYRSVPLCRSPCRGVVSTLV